MVRSLIELALVTEGFHVESVANARVAVREFDAIDPDVLVTDIDLGDRPNGIELAAILRAQAPYIGVVFLTNYPAIDTVDSGLKPPARASFVHKSAVDGVGVLRAAVESSLDDSPDPVVLELPPDNPLRRLSATQMGMLRLVAEGWSNTEIAERRGVTVRAAERLLSRTFRALDLPDDGSVNPRVVATRLYIRTFGVPEPLAERR